MPKRPIFQEIALTPWTPGQTRQEWLFREIRHAILEGRLRRGARLPSSRNLAVRNQLSRSTVTEVFRRLALEGYITGSIGSGSYVAENLPDEFLRAATGGNSHSNRAENKRTPVIESGPQLARPNRKFGVAFQTSFPAVDEFPIDIWTRLNGRVLRTLTAQHLAFGDPRGDYGLRDQILAHFGPARQVRADVDQIIAVQGVQQALDLLCRVLLRPGDTVWLEEPGYEGARSIFETAGAAIIPAPVDQRGLDVDRAIKTLPIPKIVYLTPAHQFPTGVALSLDRRFRLLCWARENKVIIFEDDYDGDYRFTTKPLGSVQGIEAGCYRNGSCVAYFGSFSKLLFPSLRLGFLVVPADLVEPVLSLRKAVDRYLPISEQKTLAEFMRTGEFGHHVRRMRELYAERWSVFSETAGRYLSDRLDIQPTECGLQTAAWLAPGISDLEVSKAADREHLEVLPISTLYAGKKRRHGLLLGFGAVAPRELRAGAQRLAGVLKTI
jgi:GntR family transcriptional regulator / MocR family aminotransferase